MNKVAKNAAWVIGVRIVQSLLALVINMLTARYLGPSNFGLITYAASLVAFVVPIMKLGFSDVMVQSIVNEPNAEGKILGTSIVLNLISALACIVGVTAFAYAVSPTEKETFLVCLLYSFVLLAQALEQVLYWFQAKLMSKYTSIIGLAAYVIVTGYKIFLLVTGKSVYWFALSYTLDYAIISIAAIFVYRKLGGQKLSFSWNVGKQMFARSHHYILSSMMVTVFAQTDKIMIKIMIDEAATGYYGAAVTCAGLTGFVFSAIIDSFRPYIFDGAKIEESVFRYRMTMLYSIVIYLSLAQSACMTLFSRLVILILYGDAYTPAIAALEIIVWYTTFSYLGSVRNIWILANEKQHYLWKINLSGALANVILNAFLIPKMGINGAAIASLITQIFTNVIVGYIIKDIRPNNRIMVEALKPDYLKNAAIKLRHIHKQ